MRLAVRSLLKAPGFSAAVVLTLAIGLGANAALFAVVNRILLRPPPYADPARLVAVGETRDGLRDRPGPVSAPTFLAWQRETRTIERLAAYRPWGFVLTGTVTDANAGLGAGAVSLGDYLVGPTRPTLLIAWGAVSLVARNVDVLVLAIRDSLRWAAAGLAGGGVLALFAARALAGALYEVPPTDLVTLAGAGAAATMVVLLGSTLAARRDECRSSRRDQRSVTCHGRFGGRLSRDVELR